MFRRDWATGIDYKADIKVLIDSYMRVESNTCYILVYTIHNTGSRTIRVFGCFVGCLSILLILVSSTTLALEQLFGYPTTCRIEWVHVPSLFNQTQNTKTKSCSYISVISFIGYWESELISEVTFWFVVHICASALGQQLKPIIIFDFIIVKILWNTILNKKVFSVIINFNWHAHYYAYLSEGIEHSNSWTGILCPECA